MMNKNKMVIILTVLILTCSTVFGSIAVKTITAKLNNIPTMKDGKSVANTNFILYGTEVYVPMSLLNQTANYDIAFVNDILTMTKKVEGNANVVKSISEINTVPNVQPTGKISQVMKPSENEMALINLSIGIVKSGIKYPDMATFDGGNKLPNLLIDDLGRYCVIGKVKACNAYGVYETVDYVVIYGRIQGSYALVIGGKTVSFEGDITKK